MSYSERQCVPEVRNLEKEMIVQSRGPLAFRFVLPPLFTASEHEPVRTGIAKVQEQAIHWGAQQERSRCLIQRCQPSLQLVDRRAAQLSEVFLLQPTIQLCAAQEGVSVAVLDNHSPNAADARIILVQRGDSTRHCADQPPEMPAELAARRPQSCPTFGGIPAAAHDPAVRCSRGRICCGPGQPQPKCGGRSNHPRPAW